MFKQTVLNKIVIGETLTILTVLLWLFMNAESLFCAASTDDLTVWHGLQEGQHEQQVVSSRLDPDVSSRLDPDDDSSSDFNFTAYKYIYTVNFHI